MSHLTLNYIDRGDPSVPDFTKWDIIPDGEWHDLDLSGIVPKGTKRVHIKCVISSNIISPYCSFRKKGNDNNINISTVRLDVALSFLYPEFKILCNTDRKIEYSASTLAWTRFDITVIGWYI